MEYIGDSSISIIDQKENKIIKQVRPYITKSEEYYELIRKLEALRKYYIDNHNSKFASVLGVNYDFTHKLDPRNNLYRLMTGSFSQDFSLLGLLKYSVNLKEYDEENELNWVNSIVNKLSCESSFSKEDLMKIFEHMYPAFGLFATECLNCIDFEEVLREQIPVQKPVDLSMYKIDPIKKISDQVVMSKVDLEVIKRLQTRSKNYNENARQQKLIAENNGRVLTLARKINRIIK